MKLGVFARREPGVKATCGGVGESRVAQPDGSGGFRGDRVDRRVARGSACGPGRLGLSETAAITTLGDGAAWIWNAAAEQAAPAPAGCSTFTTPRGTSPMRAKASSAMGPPRKTWLEEGRTLLLSDGWRGLCDTSE